MKFKKYNANINDENINDCSKRALSLAFNIPYKTVEKELNSIRDDLNKRYYNSGEVVSRFIEDHGAKKLNNVWNKILSDFCEEHPIGTYLISVHKDKEPSHITCLIDGNLYDTWDCSDWKITAAYCVDETNATFDSNFKLSDFKFMIESETKKQLNGSLMNEYPMAKCTFVSADYFDDTTERVRVAIDLANYGTRLFTDNFLIKVSYKDINIETKINEIIKFNCNRIIKALKKIIK